MDRTMQALNVAFSVKRPEMSDDYYMTFDNIKNWLEVSELQLYEFLMKCGEEIGLTRSTKVKEENFTIEAFLRLFMMNEDSSNSRVFRQRLLNGFAEKQEKMFYTMVEAENDEKRLIEMRKYDKFMERAMNEAKKGMS